MKILLLGGNGQVGTELRRSLAPLGELAVATRTGELGDKACERADFDAPESLGALVARIAPDIVVNAAAYTAVDRAEDDAQAAFRANAEAPRAIAAACAARGVSLVHYSTDYVFDGGASEPYREDAPTAPLGVYGASKLEGERAVAESGARHFIFRTAWVYAAHGKNFLLTMLRLAKERDELRVVADQVGSPTSAWLIAYATAAALHSQRASGVWHLTASGQTSWHGFAEAIVREAHARGLLARMPKVTPIATADYPTRAARPAYSVLGNSAFQRDFGIELPNWHEGLVQVLDEMAGPAFP
ncbi:dTDP-4-dehydrorhamnose reductase [Luteimonas gilva]|uniref:dTDP-4-dehydrorhamnose reductase n=1 Tax=Luteimonas gilva TaxID=2572684 RepID=A0A4V5ZQ17_9GAMM|nr:dTDP-4-dehydrorhamnose reductase [Luteimonas gilva]TKR30973.1 dTDP-4-dehydrorhamnose reductase [Luteimonas gilva]